MTLFMLLSLCLLGLALACVLPAALRPPPSERLTAAQAHLQTLRSQLSRLDQELAAGTLDAQGHALARAGIEERALEVAAGANTVMASTAAMHGRTGLGLALGVPLFALALYAGLGQPGAIDGAQPETANVAQADVEAMVAQLERSLASSSPDTPADPVAWEMLARSYAGLQRFEDAARAYARASTLRPDEPRLLAEQADVLAMTGSPTARAEADRLIRRALALDPSHLKSLALAGGAAFERKEFAAAIAYWTRARAQAPPQASAFSDNLERSIATARAELPAVTVPGVGGPAASATATASAAVRGELRIAAALAQRVAPGDVVFVYARPVDGAPIPLAIGRYLASELPLRFTLDDSMAMAPEHRLSSAAQVIVTARVSRSGDARPQPGDLLAESAPLRPGGPPLKLSIDRVQP
jgi:cytochrome c-type biogenesis protein CcmH